MAKAIIAITDNVEILYQMVRVIIEDTMSHLSFQQKERIAEASLKAYTRFTVSYLVAGSVIVGIVKKISAVLVKQLIITGFWKTLVKWSIRGAFITLPIEALVSRASDESRMLKYQHPK